MVDVGEPRDTMLLRIARRLRPRPIAGWGSLRLRRLLEPIILIMMAVVIGAPCSR